MSGNTVTQRTPWTDILRAQHGDAAARAKCLSLLAEQYYAPVQAYVRLSCAGINPADLDDLTQEFFRKFLEERLLDGLDQERGRFRDFLFVAVRNFTRQQIQAGKRLSPRSPLSKFKPPEADVNTPDPSAADPEGAFHQAWARDLMATAIAAFRAECADRGKPHYRAVFEALVLDAGPKPGRAEVAARLGFSVKDISNYLNRATNLFNRTLDQVIAATVKDEADIPAERDALRRYFKG